MSFENPLGKPGGQEKASTKGQFVDALDVLLAEMQAKGALSAEQVASKKQAAQLVEEGFSENPQNDAEIFAHAGVSDEKTLINLFEKHNGK